MSTTRTNLSGTAAAIFARLWEGEKGELPVTVARHVVKLGFGQSDRLRISELLVRNQDGTLGQTEREELDNFVTVGDLLAVLQSKARKVLKKSESVRNGHG